MTIHPKNRVEINDQHVVLTAKLVGAMLLTYFAITTQKMKFSVKDFFSKHDCGFGHVY